MSNHDYCTALGGAPCEHQMTAELSESERMFLGRMFDAYCADVQARFAKDSKAQGAASSAAMDMAAAVRLVEKITGQKLLAGNVD